MRSQRCSSDRHACSYAVPRKVAIQSHVARRDACGDHLPHGADEPAEQYGAHVACAHVGRARRRGKCAFGRKAGGAARVAEFAQRIRAARTGDGPAGRPRRYARRWRHMYAFTLTQPCLRSCQAGKACFARSKLHRVRVLADAATTAASREAESTATHGAPTDGMRQVPEALVRMPIQTPESTS